MRDIEWRKLEKATGLNRRSLERYRAAGAPMPRKGESLKAYSGRLHEWRKANRKKTGPKTIPGLESADAARTARQQKLIEEWWQKRNEGLALDIERKRRSLVPRADAEADIVALMVAFRDALSGAGARLRGRCERRDGDDVQREIEAEHRSILEDLARGDWRPQRPESEPDDDAADPEAPEGAPAAGETDSVAVGGPLPQADQG